MQIKLNNFVANYMNSIQRNQFAGYTNLAPLSKDTISFGAAHKAEDYSSIFEYLVVRDINIQGAKSPNKIKATIDDAFKTGKVYTEPVLADYKKIKWKSYIPLEYRQGDTEIVNEARKERLSQWKNILENPDKAPELKGHDKLIEKIKNNSALKLLIWNTVTSGLKENNKHIPAPFNAHALEITIDGFEESGVTNANVQFSGITFSKMYNHKLIDNMLKVIEEERPDNITYLNKNLEVIKDSNDEGKAWVKIPSFSTDPQNKEDNIQKVEILSNPNWCTRSSACKAEATLKDGDFYVYLERDKKGFWEPVIGMASANGKIAQIQGSANDFTIPEEHLDSIKKYIDLKNLSCLKGFDEGCPTAKEALIIAEKLRENNPEYGKSFKEALKQGDSLTIFKYLGYQKIIKNEDGTIELEKYTATYSPESGINIPYYFLGIDEDKLLENVSKINGKMLLTNKQGDPFYSSRLKSFPKNLKSVTGEIICNQEQLKLFEEEMKKTNPRKIQAKGK